MVIINERIFKIMIKSTYELLNNARQQIIENEHELITSLYNRAYSQKLPSTLVNIHQITKGYMLLPMAEHSPVDYFHFLEQARCEADANEAYRAEYKVALETLVRIKDMFLRDVAVNYFCEVSTCSWESNYGKHLDALYVYLDANIDDIVDNDRFGLATYMPKYDMKKLRRDLKTVEAYSLNLLLMYVAHTSYHYEGKSYTANTIITDDYAYTQVNSHDNYSHNAVSRPRLYQVFKEEYYPEYLAAFKALKKELKISTEAELKAEVSRLVDYKNPKNALEKEYFKYAKKRAKEDIARMSFFNTLGGLNPFYFMIKPILRVCLGAEAVGSFELDQPLTRKKWLGVCNMIAWATGWSVEMVRVITFICGCMGIGVLFYLALYLCIKTKLYLPKFAVKKHI